MVSVYNKVILFTFFKFTVDFLQIILYNVWQRGRL